MIQFINEFLVDKTIDAKEGDYVEYIYDVCESLRMQPKENDSRKPFPFLKVRGNSEDYDSSSPISYSAIKKPDGKILDVVNEASKKTIHSHVQAFGDFKVSQLPLSTFMLSEEPIHVDNSEDYELEENSLYENGASNSDAFVSFLERRLKQAQTDEEKNVLQQALDNEIKRRQQSTSLFDKIEHRMVPNGIPAGTPFVKSIKYDCYRASIEAFRLFCGEIDEHELAKVQIFTQLCEKFTTKEIVDDIRQTCPTLQWSEDELYF